VIRNENFDCLCVVVLQMEGCYRCGWLTCKIQLHSEWNELRACERTNDPKKISIQISFE
jgi:hypothetical protein